MCEVCVTLVCEVCEVCVTLVCVCQAGFAERRKQPISLAVYSSLEGGEGKKKKS